MPSPSTWRMTNVSGATVSVGKKRVGMSMSLLLSGRRAT
jgi:hypothetical protein